MPQDKEVYALPNITTPNNPVIFNPDICNGCNTLRESLPGRCLYPQPGKRPTARSSCIPDECWYCGCCVNDCPRPGAITFNWPLAAAGLLER